MYDICITNVEKKCTILKYMGYISSDKDIQKIKALITNTCIFVYTDKKTYF